MQKDHKHLTGFSFLDQKWGGVYPGGNYLILGSRKAGKTVLALNIIEYLTESGLKTLLLTSERRKSLEIQAASIYFDFNEQINNEMLSIGRISEELGSTESIKDLIESKNPEILVIDEILHPDLTAFKENYIDLLEYFEDKNITIFFVSSIPTNEKNKNFIRILVKNTTGIIYLQKSPGKRHYSGTLRLKPNIGHFEGEFETSYKIEPVKGMITLADNEETLMKMLSMADRNDAGQFERGFRYSNIYSVDEFIFLLESRIALSERTNEKQKIILFELIDKDIKTSEICRKFGKHLKDEDKIAFSDDKLFILPGNNETKIVQKLSEDLENEFKRTLGKKEDFGKFFTKKMDYLNQNHIDLLSE